MNLRGHRIIGFSGHMTDAPHRATPRFPEARVETVRARIRAILERQGMPLHGVSSGARGGDVLFVEEVLALGGSATIILPFPPDAFEQTSVGQGWNERFRRVLQSPRVTLPQPLHAELPASNEAQNAAFEACNDRIVDSLDELAKTALDEAPLFISVFHQTAEQQTGGTWDAIDRWRKLGRRVEIVDPLAV